VVHRAAGSTKFAAKQHITIHLGPQSKAAQRPSDVEIQKQQTAMKPQMDQARLAHAKAQTQAQTLENVGELRGIRQ